MYRVKYEDLENAEIISNVVYEAGGGGFAKEPLHLLFKLDGFKSVGTQSGIRRTMVELKPYKNEEAYIVIINTKKIDEWKNEYDPTTGILTYYGDNRTPGNPLLKTKQKGNLTFKKIFNRSYGNLEDRQSIPPIFYFESTGDRSDVKFIGLALPYINGLNKDEALKVKTFQTENGTFENYVAKFTIIQDLIIKKEWLKDLKLNRKKYSNFAPAQWLEFIQNGNLKISNNNKVTTSDIVLPIELNTKEVSYKVRLTQNKFRNKLLQEQKVCQICGIDIPELLIASHIKPWAVSDDIEKTDLYNGLLLCANHDKLFDRKLISFDDNGKIIISPILKKSDYDKLNLSLKDKIIIHPNSFKYFNYHRNLLIKD